MDIPDAGFTVFHWKVAVQRILAIHEQKDTWLASGYDPGKQKETSLINMNILFIHQQKYRHLSHLSLILFHEVCLVSSMSM